MNEKSYLEMLDELYKAVKTDTTIPQKDKEKIEKTMQKLFDALWVYSA